MSTGRAHGVRLGQVGVDGNLVILLGQAAVKHLELAQPLGTRPDTHGIVRAGNRHVLEVAVLHIRDARCLPDLGLVVGVEPHVADDREVREVIPGKVVFGRGAHVGASHLEAHECEGSQGQQQHDRDESAA